MPEQTSASRPYLAAPAWRFVHRPRAAVPATAQGAIFTVRGGPIRVRALVGKVTTLADATATNLSVIANPTSGVADVAIAAVVAIANTPVGSLIGPQAGGVGAALTIGGAIVGIDNGPVVDVGTIDLLTSATNVMQAEWFLIYEPLTPAARVSPALPATLEGYRSRPLPGPQLVHRAATALPATAQSALFTVKTGPILLLSLTGKVGTLFGATATNLTIVANPASGLTDVNLCTATAVANLAAGTLMGLQLAGIGSALQKVGALIGLATPIVVDAGTIDWLTSATDTGTAEWWATWLPLHPASRLVAA